MLVHQAGRHEHVITQFKTIGAELELEAARHGILA
jgi:hypothetical protein